MLILLPAFPAFLLYYAGGAIVLPVSLAGSRPFTGLLDLSAAISILDSAFTTASSLLLCRRCNRAASVSGW
jgi:hypothetical protein